MAVASLEGQTLGKYRVLDPLGRGGMARVYRAYHPKLDRYVAIKVLRSDLIDDELFLARFQREARAVASLRHPNIVQVFDFDVQDDVYYMVMELLEGDTLKARLAHCRACGERMPSGDMARILLDVLDGLAYAHSEGMIHRDIKPANIMLTQRGQAVLADFGIAQIVGGTQHTATGALMGTLNYMAPEQGLEGHCDARSDIYSLGIVLYEMLTDSIPFDADTPLAILMKHLNDPLPLPRQIDPSIPEPFERVLLKALAKQPVDRYQSAEEMAQSLREAVDEAHIALPERISLGWSTSAGCTPSGGCTPSAEYGSSAEALLSDSAAVFSGTARARIQDARFADDVTDTTLGTRLKQERAARVGGPAAENAMMAAGASAMGAVMVKAAPAQDAAAEKESQGSVVTAVESFKQGFPRFLDDMFKFKLFQMRFHLGAVIPGAIGLVALYNLAALWVCGWSGGWAIYRIGWPIELLMVSLALCLIMFASSTIWLLLPTWIILGNGLLFSYFSLTNNWRHWAFLWPFEPLLVASAIWITSWLARRHALSQRLSRLLGCSLGVLCIIWSLLVAIGAAIVSVIR